MVDKVFIIGNGRHAEEVKSYLAYNNSLIYGGNIVDDQFYNPLFENCFSISQFLNTYSPNGLKLIGAIGSIERYLIIERLEKSGFEFINFIHPNAYFDKDLTIGQGNLIAPMCVININVSVGNHCIINSLCNISHDCILGNYVTLSPSVTLTGKVIIEDNVFIGAGATILPNIRVGRNAVVGAAACVTKDVPNNCTVVGVPAKIISE